MKHIKELEFQKMRLRVQQLEQEKALRQGWEEMKHDFLPGTPLRNKLLDFNHSGSGSGQLVKGLMDYGAVYLTRHLSGLAEGKIETMVQQLNEKLQRVMQKKRKKNR